MSGVSRVILASVGLSSSSNKVTGVIVMVLSLSSPPLRVNSDVSSWELLCSSKVILVNVALLAVMVNTGDVVVNFVTDFLTELSSLDVMDTSVENEVAIVSGS